MTTCAIAFTLLTAPLVAQNRAEDEYTRYELLAPDTASFKIAYDVTAVTPGAKFFFNPIRKGSQASDESVIDLMTGAPLKFKEVTGQQARDAGLKDADLDTHYIQVELARPVPDGGQARIRILKTYKDAKSYSREGDAVVFNRPLGIRRNAVVLPKNYELLAASIPVQVIEEADGRIAASFMNTYPGEAPLVLRARPVKPLQHVVEAMPMVVATKTFVNFVTFVMCSWQANTPVLKRLLGFRDVRDDAQHVVQLDVVAGFE